MVMTFQNVSHDKQTVQGEENIVRKAKYNYIKLDSYLWGLLNEWKKYQQCPYLLH